MDTALLEVEARVNTAIGALAKPPAVPTTTIPAPVRPVLSPFAGLGIGVLVNLLMVEADKQFEEWKHPSEQAPRELAEMAQGFTLLFKSEEPSTDDEPRPLQETMPLDPRIGTKRQQRKRQQRRRWRIVGHSKAQSKYAK